MKYVSRTSWGGPKILSCPLWVWSRVEGIAVHHDAIKPPTRHDRGTNGCYDRVGDIHRAHLAHPEEDYCAGAYSVWVCPHDWVFELRGFKYQTGANGSEYYNQRFWAACFSGASPTPRVEVLLELQAQVLKRNSQAQLIRPHSDFKQTNCPGDPWRRAITSGLKEEDMDADERRWLKEVRDCLFDSNYRRGVDGKVKIPNNLAMMDERAAVRAANLEEAVKAASVGGMSEEQIMQGVIAALRRGTDKD